MRELMAPAEKFEQRALFAWADIHSNLLVRLLYAVPNAGGYTGGFKNNKLRVIAARKEGVRKGFPDAGLPVARGGYHGLFIELKKVTAVPSDTREDQAEWHTALREQGYLVMVCRGAEEAQRIVEDYLAGEYRWVELSGLRGPMGPGV